MRVDDCQFSGNSVVVAMENGMYNCQMSLLVHSGFACKSKLPQKCEKYSFIEALIITGFLYSKLSKWDSHFCMPCDFFTPHLSFGSRRTSFETKLVACCLSTFILSVIVSRHKIHFMRRAIFQHQKFPVLIRSDSMQRRFVRTVDGRSVDVGCQRVHLNTFFPSFRLLQAVST